ncbi:MAG: hypothetical protein D6725_13665 [Planctomycetota bacterium]|nr:MAG: hypothetical protein D6725_13665 [Planctomycetota bacterium]
MANLRAQKASSRSRPTEPASATAVIRVRSTVYVPAVKLPTHTVGVLPHRDISATDGLQKTALRAPGCDRCPAATRMNGAIDE